MMTEDKTLLRLPDVLRLIPLSRCSWYRGVKDGMYPAPVKIGIRSVAWRRTDILALIERLSSGKKEAPLVEASEA